MINSIHLRAGVVVIGLLLLGPGCRKHPYQEAIPQVEMVAVESTDDSVLAIGRLVSPGEGEMEFTGFVYSTNYPEPTLLDEQVVLEPGGEMFGTYLKLAYDSTYYFRAFASNEYGFVLSDNVVSHTLSHPKPQYAPCSVPAQSILRDGFQFPGSAYFLGDGTEVVFNGSSFDVSLRFGEVPINGIYTISSNMGTDLKKKEANFRMSAFNQYYASAGQKVYVAEEGDGKVKITFCDIETWSGAGSYTISGNITAE